MHSKTGMHATLLLFSKAILLVVSTTCFDTVLTPKPVISAMMIMALIFKQMFCRFKGAMGLNSIRPFLAKAMAM